MVMYTVYGGEKCTYCKQAVALLEKNGLAYEYFDIYTDVDGTLVYRDKLFDVMDSKGLPRPRSIPQCFLQGDDLEYIGGFAELKAHLS